MLDSTLGPERPPSDRLLDLFQERMASYGGHAPEVAAQATDPAQLDFRALKWLLVEPPWHSGRVVLIGDAVHTTTPQLAFGAGLAIEDAVVLKELVLAGVPAAELGQQLARRRYERAAVVVNNSLQLSRWEQQGGPPNPEAPKLTAASFAKLAEPI
jgi:2-polyprenyl-6-methoxyphenol hydroxylase-like FAD-dependent oxidoreductase